MARSDVWKPSSNILTVNARIPFWHFLCVLIYLFNIFSFVSYCCPADGICSENVCREHTHTCMHVFMLLFKQWVCVWGGGGGGGGGGEMCVCCFCFFYISLSSIFISSLSSIIWQLRLFQIVVAFIYSFFVVVLFHFRGGVFWAVPSGWTSTLLGRWTKLMPRW